MKILRLPLLILSLLWVSTSLLNAQQAEIDSLGRELSRVKEDSLKWYLTDRLAKKYMYSDRDSALQYAQKAYWISKNLSRYTQGLAYKNLGSYYGQTRFRSDSAIFYLNQAKDYFSDTEDTLQYARCINGIANIYSDQGEYYKATLIRQKGLKLLPSKTSEKYNIIKIDLLYGLGVSEAQRKQNASAIPSFRQALNLALAEKSISNQVMSYIGLGACYERLNQHDSAIYYSNLALPIAEKYNQTALVANLQNNLGYISIKEEDYTEALAYLKSSRKSYQQANAMGDALPAYTNSIVALTRLGRLEEAQVFAEQAIRLGKRSKDLWGQSFLYSALMELNKAQNRYVDAIKYAEKLIIVKDSLSAKENRVALNEARIKFDTENKELLNQQLQQEKEQQVFVRNIIIIASILLFILGLIAFRYRQQRVKSQLTASKALAKQAEAEAQQKEDERRREASEKQLAILKLNIASKENEETQQELNQQIEELNALVDGLNITLKDLEPHLEKADKDLPQQLTQILSLFDGASQQQQLVRVFDVIALLRNLAEKVIHSKTDIRSRLQKGEITDDIDFWEEIENAQPNLKNRLINELKLKNASRELFAVMKVYPNASIKELAIAINRSKDAVIKRKQTLAKELELEDASKVQEFINNF